MWDQGLRHGPATYFHPNGNKEEATYVEGYEEVIIKNNPIHSIQKFILSAEKRQFFNKPYLYFQTFLCELASLMNRMMFLLNKD